MSPEEIKEKGEALNLKIEELSKQRDAEQDGRKKGAFTKQINALIKEIDELSGDDREDDDLIPIVARSTTRREKYRRAGINFFEKEKEYKVSEGTLGILKADPNIKIKEK